MSSIPQKKAAPWNAPYQRLSLGQLLNIPNFLTLCRLALIPVFLGLLSKDHFRAALYVFGIAALTDSLDGTVARWSDCRTELGAILDPFADKLLLVSAFVAMTIDHAIPVWLLGVVIIRDVVIVFGYLMLLFFTSERVPVRPSYFGKTATCFQLGCIIGALLRLGVSHPEAWLALLYFTAAITTISGLHYSYCGLVWLSSHEPEMFT
jgi:cardiolipin synthase